MRSDLDEGTTTMKELQALEIICSKGGANRKFTVSETIKTVNMIQQNVKKRLRINKCCCAYNYQW